MSDEERDGRELRQRWALVEPHRERLLAIARSRCANPADAEDCVSEAMLRVVEFPALDPDRIGQLLTSVTVRLAIDTHRDRMRSRRAGLALAIGELEDPGPEGSVCDRAEAAWVAAMASTLLPERQRDVLAARASGADGSETAARLHLTYKSVESAMSRARATLRLALASTLAFLAGFYRRASVQTAPMVGAALALAFGSLVAVGIGTPARPGAAAPAFDTFAERRVAAAKLAVAPAPVPRRPAVRQVVPVPAPHPAEPTAAVTVQVETEVGGTPAGVKIEIEWHEDEGHLESIQRCLTEIEVSPEVIGCRPADP